ncbi:phosphoribosylaminoimidazolesuccinocarboxamide synthase [Neolewinella lacunae]|uniref:Phosphoribosylaminoimidazole-succinocarboxamide synthase n=1 Tax=Neolewinella lacunae TaxID=1517758 RepID=A0A923PIL9_9BACT|nr:phosphoribosylaminoimidazolesuccinocarboxamide synthase [Neolewinella lacunae]MBC6993974.1 phosphoribosylaminoimidazolesuccinocarboxamide synthase [Neolewinella lacunae]MDN3635511.1 phosphoribosylaminoimidazolesuccinocarboxamide synthase [Neolewinella lacunae]
MHQGLRQTDLTFDPPASFYRGKVRDVYRRGDQLLMVATDRISSFDHVLPKPIPHKGQILNQIAVHFLEATRDICPNWLEFSPDPNVAIGKACAAIPIEMVIRGYAVGHAWRVYQTTRDRALPQVLCGVEMPGGMRENDAFPEPIITPATKAEEGHDEDISRAEILERGLVTPEVYARLEDYTRRLFARGTAMAAERGLILVDTKYEFGLLNGEVYLIDEIHTPDSSRYFYAEGYAERQASGERQKQLSKEFVREWLMDNGFQGLEGQVMPEMPDDFVDLVTRRYTELYETITGKTFVPADTSDTLGRIRANLAGTNWRVV